MEYTVVYAENSTNPYAREDLFDEIEAKVEDLIERGWEPQGGISIGCHSGMICVCQAMVRDEDEDDNDYDYEDDYDNDYN